MKVIEILKLNKGMLKTCRKVGIRMEDVQYIELYNDYNRLLDEGEKVSYIVAVLAERYNVCEERYTRSSNGCKATVTRLQCNGTASPLKRDNGAVPLQGIKTTHHEQVLSNPEKGTCRRQDTKRQKRRKPLPTERDGNAVPCGTARYFRGTQYRTEKAQKRTVALHERGKTG